LIGDEPLELAYREHAVRLLALLTRELRSLDLAEDALQDAHVAALQQWTLEGVPDNPAGWLLTVARRRARERLRRETTLARKLPLLVTEASGQAESPPEEEEDVTTIPDERLRLVFTACHQALSTPAQIALTLRFVGGLTTREIARLFLVTEPTMAARITRAKRKIAEAGIPYRVPDEADLLERLTSVLAVVYLIFTEGYAPASGPRLIRGELCDEAIRLARVLRELMPDEPEVIALLALMLLQHARRDARVEDGRLVLLPDQNRRRWHHGEIDEGLELTRHASRYDRSGAYVLQALIAAEHVPPVLEADTDWDRVVRLYEQLERVKPSPAIRLNRAIAVAEANGAAAALSLLDGLDNELPNSHQVAVVRAELLVRLDQPEAAVAAYDLALSLQANDVVRRHLTERRDDAVSRIGSG
jgi:RNA polymerase sigma-70 factor, ECF subfamily